MILSTIKIVTLLNSITNLKKILCQVREIAQNNLKFLPSSFWTPYTAKPNGGSVTRNTSSLVAKLDLSGRLITEGGIGTT